MKKILFALFPAGVLAALFLWAANSSDGGLFQETSGLLLAFGRLAGILAAAGVLAQVLLVSRVKWLEPLYGLDRLTKAHHLLGLAVPFALMLHPVLLTLHHAGQSGLPFLTQYRAILGW